MQGYRAPGFGAATLPLTRRGLGVWSIGLAALAVVLLVLFASALAVWDGTKPSVLGLVKEGGVASWAIVFLYLPLLSAVVLLGLYLARGKPVPPAAVAGAAIVPFVLAVAGGILGQYKFLDALSGGVVEPATMLRIAAEGSAEVDSLLVFGSLASGLLAVLAAAGTAGSAITIVTRPVLGARVVGAVTAIAAIAAVFAIRLGQPSWDGGVIGRFGAGVVVLAAASAALLVERAAALDPNDASSDPGELRRTRAAIVTTAALFALAVFLLDHASFALVERRVLTTLAGHDADEHLRSQVLERAGMGISAATVNRVVDTLAVALAFLPASVVALPGPLSWRSWGASAAVCLLAVLALVASHLVRHSGMAKLDETATTLRLPELPSLPRGAPVRVVDVIVDGAGARRLSSSNLFTFAPDRSLPFVSFVREAEKLGVDGNIMLAGRFEGSGLPPALAHYTWMFLPQGELAGIGVGLPRRLPSESTLSFNDLYPASNGYLRFRAPGHAELACSSGEANFVEAIDGDFTKVEGLLQRCVVPLKPLIVAPWEGATVADVYRVLRDLPPAVVSLTTDRSAVDDWFLKHPPGERPRPPPARTIRQGATRVKGNLPPEVIQRIVRRNLGRMRLCYERGVQDNPALAGRVVVKFVIGKTGAVAVASDGGSDLPNQDVIACVVRTFKDLTFPEPEGGGVVTVEYPVIFDLAKSKSGR